LGDLAAAAAPNEFGGYPIRNPLKWVGGWLLAWTIHTGWTPMVENQYFPDTVSPPGDSVAETLEELGMTQAELSTRMGRPQKTVSEIINGKTAITPDTALQLEHVLGVPARFWLKREQYYQGWRSRQQEA
jgi:addiction module HigA family antidote